LRRDLARCVGRNLRTHVTRQPLTGPPTLFDARGHKHEKVTGVVLLAATLDTKKLPSSA
jgi:hypothetical protein